MMRRGCREARGDPMRFMMMFQASDKSEAWEQPSEKSLTEMGLVMAEMAEKGVLLAGEGLLPSSKGFRLQLDSGKRRAVDDGNSGGLEIRQVATADDFGDEFTPEARAREERTFLKAAENLQKSNT